MDIDLSSLPDSWRKERKKDVVEFTKKPRGFVISNSHIHFLPMELLPISRLFAEQFEERPAVQLGSGTYIEDGDLLVAKITPCFENGKQAIAKIGYPFAFATTEVIPLKGRLNLINTLFLHYVLLHPGIRKKLASQMDGSTNRQRLGKGVLEENVIPVPPLNEQGKISEILFSLQRAIEQQERLISLTTELKKALMNKLFTEGTRGELQKQTEIGPVPESWEIVSLGDVLEFIQYGLSVKGSESGSYQLLRMTNQVNGKIAPNNIQMVDISKEDFEKFSVRRGDLLFNRTNSFELVGRTAIFDLEGDYVFASYLIRIRVDSARLDPFFLNHYFNNDRTQQRLKSIATRAVSQSNISATRLKGFSIPFPGIEEQGKISSTLDLLDIKIERHRLMRGFYYDLFRTLLHKLMTAEIRVNDLDLSELGIEDLRTG